MRHNVLCHPARLITAIVTVASLLGCGGDTAGPTTSATSSPVGKYFRLVLNEHAINMSLTAPSNTIQLVAMPLDGYDTPLADSSTVTFTASDSNVTVSGPGVLTAYSATGSGVTLIIAKAKIGNVTCADTAFVRVTADAPVSAIQTFSMQPVDGDSAIRDLDIVGLYPPYAPTVRATDVLGNPIPLNAISGSNDIYWLGTSNQTIVQYTSGDNKFTPQDTGHVTLYATAWVYGVSVRDSLKFLVGWPLLQVAGTDQIFLGVKFFLGVGGEFIWSYFGHGDVGIIFDDSMAVDSVLDADNVGDTYTGSGNVYFSGTRFDTKARKFPKAGVYRYHRQSDPTQTGTIFVQENPK